MGARQEEAGSEGIEFTLDAPDALAGDPAERPGLSPWRLTGRRLRRDKFALAAGVVFLLIVAACLAAPLWANYVAETTPEANHLSDKVLIDGKPTEVVDLRGTPIGPTWSDHFFLGADGNGRDIMVRLLYGGRNSLMVGLVAALGTIAIGLVLGLLAGYYRGRADSVIRGVLDVIWAFPVVLLGVALGTALALGGLQIGPVTIEGDSLAIPILIIAVIYIPYLARPVRGQALALREREFVEAARAQGMGSLRVVFSEVLPNVASTLVVFLPLLVANAILLEASLSFLGAGVQPPNPSWGTMIAEGVERISSAPHLTIVPGALLVASVLSLNIFGEGVRDALDPRAKVRIEH
ncbi:MAG TPA: ABC transporter permease [Solirubrobacterales bacterium]|nr:ABC transporter permease [Solirubrobacterales bacterium]